MIKTMKKSSIIFLISTILSVGAIIVGIYFAIQFAVPTWAIGLGITLYAPLCFGQLGLFFRSIEAKPEKEIIVKEISTEPIAKDNPTPTVVASTVNENPIYKKWSKAMYERFADKWTKIFANATYPADKATRAEISVELWKIASLTMDYLLVVNNDSNALKRNREMTNAVIEGKDLTNDVELKEFFQDPTSVQQKVLIINDMLSSQLAAKQSFDIPVFGYKVELGKK